MDMDQRNTNKSWLTIHLMVLVSQAQQKPKREEPGRTDCGVLPAIIRQIGERER